MTASYHNRTEIIVRSAVSCKQSGKYNMRVDFLSESTFFLLQPTPYRNVESLNLAVIYYLKWSKIIDGIT